MGKKIRGIVLAFCLLTVWMNFDLFAAPVRPEKAQHVATLYAAALSPLRATPELRLVYTAFGDAGELRAENNPLFYVYNIGEKGGFVIVSGDDTAYPVLGYAGSGSFQAEDMPVNLAKWLGFYEKEIQYSRDNGLFASLDIQQQWKDLSEGIKTTLSEGYIIPTVEWDQLAPYNDLCPGDSTGKTVAGCVATAMAIAMKHQEWPARGIGSNTYNTLTDNIPISESFNVSYDWDNMLNEYTTTKGIPDWTATQGESVATLVYHCGVAVNMDYGTEASGAYTFDVVNALINHFNYSNSMYLAYRDLYTAEEWHELIRTELDEGRPVIYGGVTKDKTGHQFIVDGYTERNYFHINWGWSGYSNGHYLLSSLQPEWQGVGGNKEGAGYSYGQDAIIGMKPYQRGALANHELYYLQMNDESIPVNKEDENFFGLYVDTKNIVKDRPFKLCFTFLYDYGNRDFYGRIAVWQVDKNGERKNIISDFGDVDLPGGYITWDDEGIPMTITHDVEEGDKLALYYSSDRKTWKPVRGERGVVAELPIYLESPVSNQTNLSKEVVIYPTDLDNNEFNIYAQAADLIRVTVYDMTGKQIINESVDGIGNQYSLYLSGQPSGVYIVTIETRNGVSRHKVVKK